SPDSGFSVNTTPEEAKTILEEYLSADLEEKISLAGKDQMEMFIRYEYLRQVDQRWQEHLEELTALGEAVRLRSYAQKNPLVEYKNEGFELFEGMLEDLRIDIARKVFKVRIRRRNERAPGESSAINASHSSMPSLSRAGSGERKEASPDKIQIKRTAPKIGRNDPCPCGSGKKYKNCCGS
ncbi:MAG: SEC-C domain-containing protein, partial [Spirochaetaceae bacterium]|nr:SEC-C domain-containing protein [Spirochaetaceae bacterium]